MCCLCAYSAVAAWGMCTEIREALKCIFLDLNGVHAICGQGLEKPVNNAILLCRPSEVTTMQTTPYASPDLRVTTRIQSSVRSRLRDISPHLRGHRRQPLVKCFVVDHCYHYACFQQRIVSHIVNIKFNKQLSHVWEIQKS